jgi:hypothetical protein
VADEVAAELRELVRLRTRYVDEHSDRMRQLRRAVDMCFPEFTRHVRMNTVLATAILARYPTARSFASVSVRKLARLTYDGRHQVGRGTCARNNRGGQDLSGKSSLRGLPAASQIYVFGYRAPEKSSKAARPRYRP